MANFSHSARQNIVIADINQASASNHSSKVTSLNFPCHYLDYELKNSTKINDIQDRESLSDGRQTD